VTTFVGQHALGSTTRVVTERPAMQRLLRSLNSLGIILADSAQAAREAEAASTPAARRATLDRFATATDRNAARAA
jgi:hypothetical protein